MNAYTLDKAVLLSRLIVWLILVVGLTRTVVPNAVRRLYPFRVNMMATLPFSTRWRQEIAAEHLEAYGRYRRWWFGGFATILVVGLLQFAYFKFFFMKVHGFDLLAKNMAVHVQYTALRPENDADKAHAATLVTDLQHALAKYQDYHVAQAAGFEPFAPEIKVPEIDFWKHSSDPKAAVGFDPSEPHSLLYQPTPGGGYKLVGATFMAEKDVSTDQLNRLVPLSVARWHRDVNLCLPARGIHTKTTDLTKFYSGGSIATKQASDAAGGVFYPQFYGWTLQVHPWEQDPKLIWQQ
jgi:hypothetical protein